MITKEEREELRAGLRVIQKLNKYHKQTQGVKQMISKHDQDVWRDDAGRVVRCFSEWDYSRTLSLRILQLLDALSEAETRAEKAEKERYVLIDFLTDACACAKDTRCRTWWIPKTECAECWFEWAVQEAEEKE